MGNTTEVNPHISGVPVHPHTSGEYISSKLSALSPVGSSPHKWGIRRRRTGKLSRWRFIPTQVGNTPSPSPSPSPVHPHTSGEYVDNIGFIDLGYGSSPHKWGIPLRASTATTMSRFIPTQVGNTHRARQGERRLAVHPHTSGEY